MNPTKNILFSTLIGLAIACALLTGYVWFQYGHSPVSSIESGIGCLVLLGLAGALWFLRKRSNRLMQALHSSPALCFGMLLGLLWVIEISINNFITPGLPGRDIIDNSFWAVIALAMLAFSIREASQKHSFLQGLMVGIWSGLVSGLLACVMALIMIVFGMHFILQDPLNVAEWAAVAAGSGVQSMAAYFAYETFAGALGHLAIIGVGMGCLLGALGGAIGKGMGSHSMADQRQEDHI